MAAICRRCCCLFGRQADAAPLSNGTELRLHPRMSVKDRVRQINATGAAAHEVPERVSTQHRSAQRDTGSGLALATTTCAAQTCTSEARARQMSATGEGVHKSIPQHFPEQHLSTRDFGSDLGGAAQVRASESRERATESDRPPTAAALAPTSNRSSTGAAGASLPSRDLSPKPASPRPTIEEEVNTWLETVTGESKRDGQTTMQWLKDGQVLCRLANRIEPGICPRINTQQMPFKQMENVTAFIQACRKLGVMEKDVFSTVDLFEGKSEKAVINCLANLGSVVRRTAPAFPGPYIGVAQNAAVADVARAKQVAAQHTGFRKDVAAELRDSMRQGLQVGRI